MDTLGEIEPRNCEGGVRVLDGENVFQKQQSNLSASIQL